MPGSVPSSKPPAVPRNSMPLEADRGLARAQRILIEGSARRLERMIGGPLRPGGFITGSVEEIMEAAGDPHAWGSDDD